MEVRCRRAVFSGAVGKGVLVVGSFGHVGVGVEVEVEVGGWC